VIAVIDYGMGNLRSVLNALEFLGAEGRLCASPDGLDDADKVILPGVGAFRDGVAALRERGMDEAIREQVAGGKPLLGICLGMQLLASKSYEFGEHEGLGLIAGDVERLGVNGDLRVPHVGWNILRPRAESALFQNFPEDPTFYFVHSYHFVPSEPEVVSATTEYGKAVTACVEQGSVYGVQFHPEKSQRDGLKLLENFLSL
jgi:imidazole glycerol-phosphate synthase subunit HisH